LKLTNFLKKINLEVLTVGSLIAVVVWLAMTKVTWAASPSLVNIGVGMRGKIVMMNARLMDGFTNSISEAIESGVPMTFAFEIELRQENAMWNDTLISSNIVQHTVKYDSLKKVYRFSEIGKGVKRKILTRNKENYQKLMLTLDNIPIASTRSLDANKKYYVRVKADLDTNRAWFPFNHLLFFLPFSDFDTAWTESSPLSIDPDITLARGKFTGNTKRRGKNESKGINNVVRSFNK
jgi:hypothetical protein